MWRRAIQVHFAVDGFEFGGREDDLSYGEKREAIEGGILEE